MKLIAMLLLLCVGCSGGLEMGTDAGPEMADHPDEGGTADAGQELDAPAGMSGCFPDASLACGPVVARWCWASPSTFQPASACVPFHPEGGVTATGYWCCP